MPFTTSGQETEWALFLQPPRLHGVGTFEHSEIARHFHDFSSHSSPCNGLCTHFCHQLSSSLQQLKSCLITAKSTSDCQQVKPTFLQHRSRYRIRAQNTLLNIFQLFKDLSKTFCKSSDTSLTFHRFQNK